MTIATTGFTANQLVCRIAAGYPRLAFIYRNTQYYTSLTGSSLKSAVKDLQDHHANSRTTDITKTISPWEEYSELISKSLKSSNFTLDKHRQLFNIVNDTLAIDSDNAAFKTIVLERIIDRLGKAATASQYYRLALLLGQQNDVRKLVRLFNKMHLLNIRAASWAYTVLLQSLVANDALESATSLFTCMRTTSADTLPTSHIATPFGTLVLPSSSPHFYESTKATFLPYPNRSAFEILIAEYARRGDHYNVDALVSVFKSSKLKIMPQLFQTIIDSFVRRRMFSAAYACHLQLIAISENPSCFVAPNLLYLKNVCVSLSHLKRPKEALQLLVKYSNTFQYSSETALVPLYKFLMTACTTYLDPETALDILQHFILSNRSEAQSILFCESVALISEKCNRVDILKQVFDITSSFKTKQLTPILLNIYLQKFAHFEKVKELDTNAASKSDTVQSLWVEIYDCASALKSLADLKSTTFVCLVDRCIQDKNMSKAVEIHSKMYHHIPFSERSDCFTMATLPLFFALMKQSKFEDAWKALDLSFDYVKSPNILWDQSNLLNTLSEPLVELICQDLSETTLFFRFNRIHSIFGANSGISDGVALRIAKNPSSSIVILPQLAALSCWTPSVSGLVSIVDTVLEHGPSSVLCRMHYSLSVSKRTEDDRLLVVLDALLCAASVMPLQPTPSMSTRLSKSEVDCVKSWMEHRDINFKQHPWINQLISNYALE
ncbi:hypothetical protein QVD99_001200 [Batrachochytrium dendrobatidis]|nr:hypothetical protein QVD99_001200 [Batrachochytrium dendrobatidis]